MSLKVNILLRMMLLYPLQPGLPISYFVASNWLEGFAFRIDLKWWFLLLQDLLHC